MVVNVRDVNPAGRIYGDASRVSEMAGGAPLAAQRAPSGTGHVIEPHHTVVARVRHVELAGTIHMDPSDGVELAAGAPLSRR